MRRLVFLALAIAACERDPAGPVHDAGATLDTSSPDAGAPLDPTAVAWEPIALGDPAPRAAWGAMAADPGDGTAIVIGGTDAGRLGGTAYDGAWRVDLRGPTVIAERIDGAGGPSPRYCGCATWDAARDRALVVGGRDLSGPYLAGETWSLDPEVRDPRAWSELAVTTPRGVIGCAMAHSASRGATYLFGGAGEGGFHDETWRLDADRDEWIRVAEGGPAPNARYDAVLLPIEGGARLLLFAGSYGSEGAAFFSDVWIFDVASETWSELTIAGATPVGRRLPWARMDGDRGMWAGLGFDGTMAPLGDLAYLDLEARTWSPIELTEGPGARGFAPALATGDGAIGALLDGLGASGVASGAWRLVRR